MRRALVPVAALLRRTLVRFILFLRRVNGIRQLVTIADNKITQWGIVCCRGFSHFYGGIKHTNAFSITIQIKQTCLLPKLTCSLWLLSKRAAMDNTVWG